MKSETKKSFKIGSLCVFTYITSYYMRNILSVSTPAMLESNRFNVELIGMLSSVYFFVYAVGQLLNGVVGDIINPRKMVSAGIFICGVSSILFASVQIKILQIFLFALMGFSLSMLRGPLVKTISENTPSKHSKIICTFFSFAGFSGPLIASLVAMFFDWRRTFIIAGTMGMLAGFAVYVLLGSFERKGYITPPQKTKKAGLKSIFEVFKLNHFLFYITLGALCEITSVAISFWIPTYLTEMLNFRKETSNLIFSAMAIIKSIVPFLTLFLFFFFKEKDIIMSRFSFFFATLFILGVLFISNRYINAVCILMAQMALGTASSLLWSIYIPSQRESGLVSTLNGVIDFSGYFIASLANILFVSVMNCFGWEGIIIIWCATAVTGLVMAIFTKQDTN